MDTSEWIVVCTADTVCWRIISLLAETGVRCWHSVQPRSSTTASNPTSTTLSTTSSLSSGSEQHGTLHQMRNWQSHMAVTANCGLITWVWSLQRAASACCMITWMMKVCCWQACRFDSSPCVNVIFSICVKNSIFISFQVPDVWVHLLLKIGKRLGFYSCFVSLILCTSVCPIVYYINTTSFLLSDYWQRYYTKTSSTFMPCLTSLSFDDLHLYLYTYLQLLISMPSSTLFIIWCKHTQWLVMTTGMRHQYFTLDVFKVVNNICDCRP